MSAGILILELLVIIITIGLYFGMKKMGYKKIWKKFIIMILAILLFMIISEPMYRNQGLDTWAYLYRDVAWTLVLGFADIFLISIAIVDKLWGKFKEKAKFWLYLLVVTIITVPIESGLLKIGVRGYSPILTDTFSGFMIPLTRVPIEVFLAVPILAALVIGFYMYFAEQY